MVNTHPWRQLNTVDSVVGGRSPRFSAYLSTLPLPERRVIERAERAFVAKSDAAISSQRAVLREYTEGMLGVKDDEVTFNLTG